MASKTALIKKIEVIQGKIQSLWAQLGTNGGMNCQTASREMGALKKKIERNEIKIKK